MYNKKKATDKPVGKSSGLNHSSSGKASEKHNFPKQNDSKKASDVCPVHKKCGGWKVKVENSTTALSDMATGKLTVWAAAWSSTIDPDMYQVYHKDSQATSVKLWGYPQIKNGKTTLYSYEWGIIQELSDLIDEGRSKLKNEERVQSYYDALDLVMELAVEMPTYQRKDMMAYNSKVIDETSLTPENERTAYNGLTSRIWEVTFR